jgi:type VI protein secretion system component Hcp
MAVQDMKVVTLPGRGRLKIPVVGTRKNNELSGVSKATKEWTVRIDNIFEHTSIFSDREIIEKDKDDKVISSTLHFPDENEVELFGFTYNTQRETLGHSVNQLIASASIRHSDVILIIQNSTYSPRLEQCMNNGTVLYEVVLHRSGFINGANRLLEERMFRDCNITRFIQILDFVVLHIRVLSREETSYMYAQGVPYITSEDGKSRTTSSQGQSVSTVDFRHGLSTQAHTPSE